MRLVAVLGCALVSTASAHSDPREGLVGVPKFIGGRKFLAELKARNALPAALESVAPYVEERGVPSVETRQNNDGQCGPGIGSCATDCCSPAG